MQQTDIAIVGAGPAGAATALRLSFLGISCLLIDKSDFPRDKICGDALSGKVTVLLDRLDPAIMNRFRQRFTPTDIWGIRFYAPNDKLIELPFNMGYERKPDEAPGYVSKRMDFDAFLIEEVKRRDNITLKLNTAISNYERTETGYELRSKDGSFQASCRLLIDASGAHSIFSRREAGLEKDNNHYASAVRSYFSGVTGFHPDNFIELHFLEKYNPGYFWIFPLPSGQANVGIGMRSDILKKRDVNLRAALDDVIQSEQFRERFANATQLTKTVGYGLPLGSKSRKLSGDHYLLTGDAGHLVDPLTGEGIGNAVYSGFIAAELAEQCLAEDRFDADFLAAYDVRIARVLRSELKLSYRLQQVIQQKWITNLVSSFIVANPKIIETICRMYTDMELRKQLVNPLFWIRQFFGRKKVNPTTGN